MIPKIIHYCWFGNKEMSREDISNVEGWRKLCPDYKIIVWNEKNYDVSKNRYMFEAYKAGKFGFVPDYARLDIIYHYGGFYFDTDVQLLKNLDFLLNKNCIMGFESANAINHGHGFAAEPGNEIIKKLLDMYGSLRFINPDGTLNLTPSPVYISNFMKSIGLKFNNKHQFVSGVEVFPNYYFCPKDYLSGKIHIRKETVSIHKFNVSWMSQEDITKMTKIRRYSRFLGIFLARNVVDFEYAFKKSGLKGVNHLFKIKLFRKRRK
jgi:hypothetical protein